MEIFFRQAAGRGFRGDAAVFLNHLHRVHAQEYDGHFRLIIEPAEGPFGGRPSAAAVLHNLFCAGREHVDELAAPEGFHDDDRNSLCGSGAKTVHAGLGNLVEVVVLDLAEIPVVIVQDLLKIIGVSVVGKTDIPDGAALFFSLIQSRMPTAFSFSHMGRSVR